MVFTQDVPIDPTTGDLPLLPSGQQLALETRGMVSSCGLGGKLWPAASVLCRHLRQHTDELLGGSSAVLELGCGLGAVGLYAAALGAHEVLLTDGGDDALLQVASANAQANRDLLRGAVRIERFSWGSHELPTLQPSLILGSDVTYARASHSALCASLHAILARGSRDAAQPAIRALLAHEHRRILRPDGGPEDEALEHFHEVAVAARLQVSTRYTARMPTRVISILEVALGM